MNTENCYTDSVAKSPRFQPPTAFEHITLTSGHTCLQHRNQVSADVIEYCAKKIRDAHSNNGWAEMKDIGDSTLLQLAVSGTSLEATLWLKGKSMCPAVVMRVVTEESSGTFHWQSLCDEINRDSLQVTSAAPSHPWIGVVLNQPNPDDIEQVLAYLEMMQWAGDFERCLAWGFVKWLESKESHS